MYSGPPAMTIPLIIEELPSGEPSPHRPPETASRAAGAPGEA
jgi:hypothetical protein